MREKTNPIQDLALLAGLLTSMDTMFALVGNLEVLGPKYYAIVTLFGVLGFVVIFPPITAVLGIAVAGTGNHEKEAKRLTKWVVQSYALLAFVTIGGFIAISGGVFLLDRFGPIALLVLLGSVLALTLIAYIGITVGSAISEHNKKEEKK